MILTCPFVSEPERKKKNEEEGDDHIGFNLIIARGNLMKRMDVYTQYTVVGSIYLYRNRWRIKTQREKKEHQIEREAKRRRFFDF
jgi:hypothetical protein